MLPPLSALRCFEVASQAKNFSVAADILCITPSAVSHQIKTLEVFLGRQLFVRNNRRMQLTHEGEIYARKLSQVFIEIEEATSRLLSSSLAPALAAGATAVVKPAEQTPLTALLLNDYLAEAGLPAGVYNVVCGPGHETGAALVAHPDIAHVTFTGSVPTGQSVMRSAASHIASVTLELGGKSPVVVLADADLDAACEGVLKAIFTNSGQVCSAGSRLIVERTVTEPLIRQITERIAGFRFGRGIDNPDLGPLVSAEQLSKISSMVEAARRSGVAVLSGAEPKQVKGLEGGWFYAPTLLRAEDPFHRIVQDEIFGPVLVIQVAEDFDHAVALANGTPFGLVAGIYSRDISRAFRFAKAVDAGQVFINQFFAGGVETPFGGTKMSGFGREKGLEAVRSYYRVKTITARI